MNVNDQNSVTTTLFKTKPDKLKILKKVLKVQNVLTSG